MNKHLWHLNIEQIPLGWQEEYDNALNKYPNGMPLLVRKNKFNVHPVSYKKQLIQKFNESKEQALFLQNNLDNDPQSLSKLLELDIILFKVLFLWLIDGTLVDETFFDINKLQDSKYFIDIECYFLEEDNPHDPIFHYHSYKFFRLSNLNTSK